MEKNIYIGDIHGLSIWKQIVMDNPDFDNVVFIGDYLDSFDIGSTEQFINLKEIIEFKLQNIDRVHLLIGNHDIHYWENINSISTSGYQPNSKFLFNQLFVEYKNLFKMCVRIGNNLCTHAGISSIFLSNNGYDEYKDTFTIEEYLNELFIVKPHIFLFENHKGNDITGYGDDVSHSPIWIRPKSLQKSNINTELEKEYIQIVGHTNMSNLDISSKTTGGKYYYIDTLPNNEYLIEIDGVFKVGKTN